MTASFKSNLATPTICRMASKVELAFSSGVKHIPALVSCSGQPSTLTQKYLYKAMIHKMAKV